MTDRRLFLGGCAGLITWPIAGRARDGTAQVGWLSTSTPADSGLFLDALRQGLGSLGRVPRALSLTPRWGEDRADGLAAMAADLVASRPDVIVAQGAAALLIRQLTSTIPVVFGFSGDPVEAGLVRSLARPGGNLTGISFLTLELVGKRVQLLHELAPKARRLAVIALPQHPGDNAERRISEHAAAAVGLTVVYFEARNGAQLLQALPAIEKAGCDAAMFFPVQYAIALRERIAQWSWRTRIPTGSGWAQFAEGGNLLSYGPNLVESFRRLAWYVDRILKGARPDDLPVEQPSRVEFVVNLKAARALGVKLPGSMLLRADRVIDPA